MEAAQSYITVCPRVDYGMLFTSDIVCRFYEKLGRCRIMNPVNMTTTDRVSKRVMPTEATITMIYSRRKAMDQWPNEDIDLNGPEW
jgi:hypothetical protein